MRSENRLESGQADITATEKPDTSRQAGTDADPATSIGSDIAAYLPALKRHALRLTQNFADADDLVQECVLRALIKIEQFEPGTNLRGWLTTILTHIFIEGVRRRSRHRDLLTAHAVKQKMESAPDQLARLEFLAVDRALADLPAELRAALTLVTIDQVSYSETAQRTGVPIGTIRSRVSRARQLLMSSVDGRICTRYSLCAPLERPSAAGLSSVSG